jgi:hypothetical protein
MLKLRTILVTTMAAALVACTSPPRVQTTNGPTAELNDRLQADDDGGRPRVFAVTAINGVEIPNALNGETRVGFWGHGQGMLPYMIARNVEAKPTTYRVRGAYLSRAPIETLVRLETGQIVSDTIKSSE